MNDIGVFEAIYSQRQFTRYKPDLVPREAIDKIIDAATKAPSGGNKQPWHFIAITERDLIEKIGGLYRDLWLGAMGATPPPGESPAYTSARYLANHMPEVPAMILVCADHTMGTVPYTKGDPSNGAGMLRLCGWLYRTCSWPLGRWAWAPESPPPTCVRNRK